MPRSRRRKSGTDVYHVVSRGNNRIAILETDAEKNHYIRLIKEKKDKYGVDIYAYCIMSNHVHILLSVDFEYLPLFMKEINLEFAVYYNTKHGNTGHVFQSRYYSGCVETESYLVSCIRYIHNNPVKAAVVGSIVDYPFSSAAEYFSDRNKYKEGCISKKAFEILDKRFQSRKAFYEFHDMFDTQEFIDISEDKKTYDEERVFSILDQFMEENKISSIETLLSVNYFKELFLKQCRAETEISKQKVENILKMAVESTCPILSNLSDIN